MNFQGFSLSCHELSVMIGEYKNYFQVVDRLSDYVIIVEYK